MNEIKKERNLERENDLRASAALIKNEESFRKFRGDIYITVHPFFGMLDHDSDYNSLAERANRRFKNLRRIYVVELNFLRGLLEQ